MIARREKCAGPVYFGDQGIEVCTVCGGCICCDFVHVDHDDAERECVIVNGRCCLKVHGDRKCTVFTASPDGTLLGFDHVP